jgi:hypothetical protein
MSMDYTVDIERSVDALANCLKRVNNGINDIWDWRVSINAGGIDYGIYFNFDLENKELEICNQPADGADDSLYLDEIIEIINEETEN